MPTYRLKSRTLVRCLVTAHHFISTVYCSDTGEGGQGFITVENCGDNFLAALADATLPTDGWGDLKAIETEACDDSNEMDGTWSTIRANLEIFCPSEMQDFQLAGIKLSAMEVGQEV